MASGASSASPAPRLSSSHAGARGEGGEVDSGCGELDEDGSQALGWAGVWLEKTSEPGACKASHQPCHLQFCPWLSGDSVSPP